MAEIGFWPNDSILSFSHFGLSLFATSLIRQLPKIVQPWFFSFVIETLIFWAPLFLIFIFEVCFNFPTPAAARSLATPLTPKQSGRLGVIDKSITFSVLFLKKFFPQQKVLMTLYMNLFYLKISYYFFQIKNLKALII